MSILKTFNFFGRRLTPCYYFFVSALLMAARLHDFNRTVGDVVKVVQVHEATLRKR